MSAIEAKEAQKKALEVYLEKREGLSETLASLAELIGDRDGLETLHTMFIQSDHDGSGQLSPSEFGDLIRDFEAQDAVNDGRVSTPAAHPFTSHTDLFCVFSHPG